MAGSGLGQILDGWSELLDNHADQENALKEGFLTNIKSRNIAGVENTAGSMSIGGASRPYFFSSRKSGASVTTNINKYGSDLFIKWTLWWKPKINWMTIGVILGLALLVGIIAAGSSPSIAILNPDGSTGTSSPYAFSFFLGGALISAVGIFFGVGILGSLIKGSFYGFFLTEFNLFNQDDAIALSFAVDHSLRQAADAIGIKIKLRERTDFYVGKRSRLI